MDKKLSAFEVSKWLSINSNKLAIVYSTEESKPKVLDPKYIVYDNSMDSILITATEIDIEGN